MIEDISNGLVGAATIGQVPEWHPWLMGSKWLRWVLATQPFFRVPDPLRTVVKVSPVNRRTWRIVVLVTD
jgi:hypothetical protein